MTRPLHTTQAGTLDPTFANNGVLNWVFPEFSAKAPQAVFSLPDGKLIVISRLSGRPAGIVVVRLTANGDIDTGTGFGKNEQGFFEIFFPGIHISFIFGVGPLADAGVLVTCQYYNGDSLGSALIRLLKDGRPDEGFGDGGIICFDPLSGGTPEQVKRAQAKIAKRKVAGNILTDRKSAGPYIFSGMEQSDGKIVLMTTAADYSVGELKGMVIRLNPDGTFDEEFNGCGRVFVSLEGVIDTYGTGLAIQPDGKLVVFGEYLKPGEPGWYVVRFNSDGQQDAQFSNLMLPSPEYRLTVNDIAVRETDGLIALIGYVVENFYTSTGAIFVLNRNGGFNLVFNHGEPHYTKLTHMGQTWSHCAFGGDRYDKLIISGVTGGIAQTDNTLALTARYLLTSELDQTFNKQGWVVFDNRNWLEVTRDMATTAQRSIVVCGEYVTSETGVKGGWITRYLA